MSVADKFDELITAEEVLYNKRHKVGTAKKELFDAELDFAIKFKAVFPDARLDEDGGGEKVLHRYICILRGVKALVKDVK